MLTKDEYIFTIGYDGPAAVVDGQAKRRYSGLSSRELAEKGLFRAAYCSAVYSKDPTELQQLVEIYNRCAGTSYTVDSALDRLFGVFPVEVKRSIVL
jgi:hypothetical protein